MRNEDRIVESYQRDRLQRRNMALAARLALPRTFAAMLAELGAVRGLKDRAVHGEEPAFFEIPAPNV